eukprot:gene11058-7689_t
MCPLEVIITNTVYNSSESEEKFDDEGEALDLSFFWDPTCDVCLFLSPLSDVILFFFVVVVVVIIHSFSTFPHVLPLVPVKRCVPLWHAYELRSEVTEYRSYTGSAHRLPLPEEQTPRPVSEVTRKKSCTHLIGSFNIYVKISVLSKAKPFRLGYLVFVPKDSVATAAVAAQALAMCLAVLHSRLTWDPCLAAHWKQSNPVVLERVNWWRFWRRSFYFPVLRGSERSCLDAWLSIMALRSPLAGASGCIAPCIVTQDSVAFLDGLQELRDASYLLSKIFHEVRPAVYALHRERQGDAVLLHGMLRSDVVLRLPFTSITFCCYSFPSAVTLVLEHPPTSFFTFPKRRRRVITVAEHHWFGGRIWSSQTGSFHSSWGDIGDISRRFTGFCIAVMQTNRRGIQQRVEDINHRYEKAVQDAQSKRFERSMWPSQCRAEGRHTIIRWQETLINAATRMRCFPRWSRDVCIAELLFSFLAPLFMFHGGRPFFSFIIVLIIIFLFFFCFSLVNVVFSLSRKGIHYFFFLVYCSFLDLRDLSHTSRILFFICCCCCL